MNTTDIFQELAALPRWVPYHMVFNPKREKFDKIPSNGARNLSTKAPTDWDTLLMAASRAQENNLPGIGFILTGGVRIDGWRLMGLDFDDVDQENFALPFSGYCETSPSGNGVRSFAWVPEEWAEAYKDTVDALFPNCSHMEVYLGTSPRFLTVTFQAINLKPIPRLEGKALVAFSSRLKPAEAPIKPLSTMSATPGTPLDLTDFKLTPEQWEVVNGQGQHDRSAVIHGLVIKLIDDGAPREDILATMMHCRSLREYCLSHRHNDESRAMDFAREEIEKAYRKSRTGLRERLVGFNEAWAQSPDKIPLRVAEEELGFPVDLYTDAPGIVGEIARWIMGASMTPREEFAYASALVMTACLIGPYCTVGTSRSKMNLYITLVGGTGMGKNEAIDQMALLLSQTDAKDCITDFPASEAALRRHLNAAPNLMIRCDELAHKLESMENNANGSGLGRAILEAYNGARMPPKPYADDRRNLPAVDNPYVQLIGGTTDKVWDVVKSGHMEDGTLNRFMFACLPDKCDYRFQMEPDRNVPKALKDKLNAFFRQGRRYDLLGFVPAEGGRNIQVDREVKAAILELNAANWDRLQMPFGGLYSRLVQNTVKVAAILAVGDGKDTLTMPYFLQAKRFVNWAIANTYAKCTGHMADSKFERYEKKLLLKLKENHGKMTVRDAYRVMHIPRREMEELIATMMQGGQVITFEEQVASGHAVTWVSLMNE